MAAQDTALPDAQLEPPTSLDIESLELFRRSPHPYYHRQTRRLETSAESSSNDFLRTSLQPGQDRRERSNIIPSPSESGTEADDEGLGFIKALPAPPLRPRKGLRAPQGTGLDGGASPLLTPSLVDEDGPNFANKIIAGFPNGGPSPTDDEAQAARQKYWKRRRNEIVRRVTETALLAAISLLAIQGSGAWATLLERHQVELLMHALVMVSMLALYPVRLIFYSLKRAPSSDLRFRQRIRIPAAFDPAPVLYPAVIPVLISISLFTSNQALLLPNILLGLAAIPPQLIPNGIPVSGYSSVHWLTSILPLIAFQKTHGNSDSLLSDLGLHPELLVTLFPLHQALLPPLHYLTTTSLLTTELHLLSIGLINLLLFTDSPQGDILAILLWLGGVGVFVLCGKVLKWGVALARIPKWRFRRAGQIIRTRQSFIHMLNQRIRSRWSNDVSRVMEDSDADEDSPLIKVPAKRNRNLTLKVIDALCHDDHHPAPGGEVQSAVEVQKGNGFEKQDEPNSLTSLHKRRNTLPSLPSQTAASPRSHHHHHPHRRRARSVAQSFLALTPNQALARKWMYAMYFYLVVIALILGPIRYFIGKYALHGHEPFGWAIGYLFGNIQRVRFEVYNWDLENWIPLPPLPSSTPSSTPYLSPIEHARHITLGEATTRLLLCIYCALTIAIGLIVVLSLSTVIVEVDTRRKVFHGTMVAMLLPTVYIDPCFVSLALALVLAMFLLLDLIRASQLPPLAGPIATFLTPYVDGRDLRGPVVVSHIFLLIGCAIPLWLSLAGVHRTGEEPWVGWDAQTRDVSMVSGVVCVGMGDAAASLVGRRFGRRKWIWKGGKSLEGSLAFAGAVTLGLVVGKVWLGVGWGGGSSTNGVNDNNQAGGIPNAALSSSSALVVLAKAALCAAAASLEEAVLTGGNDNVIVPVVLWVLVRGVRL